MARDWGLRLIGLSQVYPFNDGAEGSLAEIARLAETASACAAETISLIPRVDGEGLREGERQATRRDVLAKVLPSAARPA